MFDKIIAYSVENKFVIMLMVVAICIWGAYSLKQIPIDAVPDITNNQIQVITTSPTLATQEVEQFITRPIELSLQSLQQIEEIRSISRFGLSVVTVVFKESHDVYLARQLVAERINEAQENIPEGLGSPEMAPISTGLGEIYQYVIDALPAYKSQYSLTELRSIQDWIVKRQLLGIEGVAEINSMGGYLKQYEVAIQPDRLKALNINIEDVFEALENSNENTGGAYIEKNPNTYYIRSEGLVKSLDDIGHIVVTVRNNSPILIKDVARVQFGKAPRYGALVRNGVEVVGGKVMMFKGANSSTVTKIIRERVEQIQKSLPEGVYIEPYLVRDKLVKTAIGTVKKNLLEGGLIVIFILVMFLGNWRAGLIVASVIPIAMLFAISMMNLFGISANLMSLGAIDFGLIVDGAVIIVEAIIHRLHKTKNTSVLNQREMNATVIDASQKIRSSAAFGEIIILIVYIPILALVGIEGKMFKPMAQTVMLAILGALILSLTYVPMMSALFLQKTINNKKTFADRLINFFHKIYQPVLEKVLQFKLPILFATILLFVFSLFRFSQLGGEFIPTLEEGDLAMQHIIPPGSSLSQSVISAQMIQNKLLEEFPEIEDVIANIGSAEIPTDPMPVEIADYTIIMKPKSEWTSASNRQDFFDKIDHVLSDIPGIAYEYSQPIQLRFNELMTGSKADIAIKLFGEDLDVLFKKATEAQKLIMPIKNIGTVNVEQTIGMPQIIIEYNYQKMAQYGLHVKEVNKTIRAAFAGEKAGIIYEGEKRFDLIVRLDAEHRQNIKNVENLYISLANGNQIPLSAVAKVALKDSPMQISRENTNRGIIIGVNVGNSDVATLVKEIKQKLDAELDLPTGYYINYGGQFENLQAANARLSIALPLALCLIFILLYFTFGSASQATLIFTAIPLSAIGGIWALVIRGMPFSISAGIGFIALFGVAVLNGIVLIGYFNQLKKEGMNDIYQRIMEGTKVRLRPVLLTALVASLGFLPMALSVSGGAEVQRPLATVVIGGLISATFLTLIIIPILYYYLEHWNLRRQFRTNKIKNTGLIVIACLCTFISTAQTQTVSLDQAISLALENNPAINIMDLKIQSTAVLQNQKYNLGPTQIFYQSEALYKKNQQSVTQFGIKQNIPHPSIIKAKNAVQNELLELNKIDKKLTQQEIKLIITNLYTEIQYKEAGILVEKDLIGYYSEYKKRAETKVKFGETNAIELMTLSSKINDQQLSLDQSYQQIKSLKALLKNYINGSSEIEIEQNPMLLTFVKKSVADNIRLKQFEQKSAIETANLKLKQTQTKANFSFGYAAQKYFESNWLSGIEASISLPLSKTQIKSQIEVQKNAVDISNSQMINTDFNLNNEKQQLEDKINIHQKTIEFYTKQINEFSPELIRISKLNYEAGQLSYLELINSLNLLASYRFKKLETINKYNKSVAQYQFITNQ